MKEIGIGVTADYGSSDDQWNKLVAFEYDLNNNNWSTVANGDPTEYMANWYGKSGSNYCGYQSDAYDAAYEKFLETPDAEGRAALLQEMQQILIDDAAVVIDGYYNSCPCGITPHFPHGKDTAPRAVPFPHDDLN